ncbi:MAG TPA: helix-turn-helix domain-containing protein [Lacipirellulaceae bacterium]|jgi:predicted site-specific integrase-resolvase|nr:helix-turn-helix domain-containing protein [Lacipirellulaceae bacterium]
MVKLNEYVKIAKAAEILGVSQNTLRNWSEAGKIRFRRNPVNGYRLFRLIDLEKFLAIAAEPVEPSQQKRVKRKAR